MVALFVIPGYVLMLATGLWMVGLSWPSRHHGSEQPLPCGALGLPYWRSSWSYFVSRCDSSKPRGPILPYASGLHCWHVVRGPGWDFSWSSCFTWWFISPACDGSSTRTDRSWRERRISWPRPHGRLTFCDPNFPSGVAGMCSARRRGNSRPRGGLEMPMKYLCAELCCRHSATALLTTEFYALPYLLSPNRATGRRTRGNETQHCDCDF